VTDHAANLRAALRGDLKSAMLGRRTDEVAALRALIAAIDNAQAVTGEPGGRYVSNAFADGAAEVARKLMSEDDLRTLLDGEIAARRAAADQYRGAGHADRADHLSREAEIIARYIG